MKVFQKTSSLASLLLLLSNSPSSTATPFSRDIPFGQIANAIFLGKRCANPCGWNGQLCCTANQQCFTDAAGQAQCGIGAGSAASAQPSGNGQWQYFTTTYVATDLVTRVSTYSSFVAGGATAQAAPTATSSSISCDAGNIPCGSICCASGQYCASAGQCAAANGDFSSSAYSSYQATTSQTFSAPLRPTSESASTITSSSTTTGTASTTMGPTISPIGTAGGIVTSTGVISQNGGLSGGAIAGIVIGVIIGIILLLLICCLGCGVAGVRTVFGHRRTRRDTYIRESHHSGRSSHAGGRTNWFGSPRPSRPPAKSGLFGGFGPVIAGLGTLALLLGLKRRHDRRKREYESESSEYSYYDTSTSSESTDPRSRSSRPTRR